MSNNLKATRLEPRAVRHFVDLVDDLYFRLLRKKSFERVVFFQPELKNVCRIGKVEVDSYLLPYLVKNLQIDIDKAEREEIVQSIPSRSATSPVPKTLTARKDKRLAKPNNPFEEMLATQLLANRIHCVYQSSRARVLQEALWKVKLNSNRKDESKLFLLSMFSLVRKFENRRLKIFASDSRSVVVSKPQINKSLLLVRQLFDRKNKMHLKDGFLQMLTHQRILEFYERVYEEPFVSAKQACLRVIGEFDRRPNSFGSVVNNRTDYLRFLLTFKLLHEISEKNARSKLGSEFLSRLDRINQKRRVAPEETRTFINVLTQITQKRKMQVLSYLRRLPSPVRPKSHILMSQVMTGIEFNRSRVFSMRIINAFCLILQDVFNGKKKKAMSLIQSYGFKSQNTKNQKIIYARVEYLRKPSTMGSFVLPDVTQVITPRANMSTTLGPYQSPMRSSKISELISLGSPHNQKRRQRSATFAKKHGPIDQAE